MNRSTKSKNKTSSQSKNATEHTQRNIPGVSLPFVRPTGLVPWARRQFPHLRDEFQHLSDRIWNYAEDELFAGGMKVPVDISETDKLIEIEIDAPGFELDEIDIQVSENTITIRSQRETNCCTLEKTRQVHRAERPSGPFNRTFALPSSASENAVAKYENGVLTISLTKNENRTFKKIKVRK